MSLILYLLVVLMAVQCAESIPLNSSVESPITNLFEPNSSAESITEALQGGFLSPPHAMEVLEAFLMGNDDTVDFEVLDAERTRFHEENGYIWSGPSTIFVPGNCLDDSCLDLGVYIIPGIFPLKYLKKLGFGAKLVTLTKESYITVTSNKKRVFINGLEIIRPSVFNTTMVIAHQLAPRNSSPPGLSAPKGLLTSVTGAVTSMLFISESENAVNHLPFNRYIFLHLRLRFEYLRIFRLKYMTLFAINDYDLVKGLHFIDYFKMFRYHIIPNMRLLGADLMSFPVGTKLPTLAGNATLVIDPSGSDFMINFVSIKRLDVIYNERVAIHLIRIPLQRIAAAGADIESDSDSEEL